MPRVWMAPTRRPEPCPPHEWEEVDDEYVGYLLRCAKHPDHIWPDPRDRRD